MKNVMRLAISAAMLVAIGGCEFDKRFVAPTSRQVIVHSVLNPAESEFVVLVEELLTGRVDLNPDEPFREGDPIATGSGVPIGGARVVVYNAAGDSAVATEVMLQTRSTGVYSMQNSANADPSSLLLLHGARYFLKVTTPSGVVVTGSTVIPGATATQIGDTVQFNRDSDTLRLAWSPSSGAKTYLVRVNSPRGPYHIFTDSLNIRLPGSLRDFFSERLPSVFVPGFTQALLLSAIDTNFYDYYRTQNNPFSGTGLINRLQGGTGLFGSMVPIASRIIMTTAFQEQPIEGLYLAQVGFASSAPDRLMLYVESQRGSQAAITGNYERQAVVEGGGVLGYQNGSTISLAFLRQSLATDTLATFRGTVYPGDSIVGDVRGERIVYRKQ